MAVAAASSSSSAAGTLVEERAALQRRLDATLDCVRTLLSPAQQRSKAWRPVAPQQQYTAAQHLQQSSSPAKAATAAATSAQQARGAASQANRVASSSRHRLEDSSSSYLLPIDGPIQVHRRPAKRSSREDGAVSSSPSSASPLLPPASSLGADIYRATCHIPVRGELDHLATDDVLTSIHSLLATPECRPLWDQMVEESFSVEELDPATRITRTIFKLGWPASQRDAITVSRSLREEGALIDISTSLPRSPDAPAYLRPAPPFVRSHVNLFAWCFERSSEDGRPTIKVSVFWSWDLRGAWLGMPAGGLGARLPHMVQSLTQHVRDGDAARVPSLTHFGRLVEVVDQSFDATRDMLFIAYQIVSDNPDELIEKADTYLSWSLPAAEGWDVHISITNFDSRKEANASWEASATQSTQGERCSSAVQLALRHTSKDGANAVSLFRRGMRGEVTVQRIAASQDVRLRINDEPQDISKEEWSLTAQRDEIRASQVLPSSPNLAVDDSASVSGISLQSEGSSAGTAEGPIKRVSTPVNSSGLRNGSIASTPDTTASPRAGPPRSAADRTQALASIVRRNYIYFTSLLQEPEQKWKAYSDARGVTITQLDSIDPTLVVYRAEATFVGVTTWDLFAAIGNPGVKSAWDKGAEESQLIQDVGDASRLWWTKSRGLWPVSARDSVTLETSYKSQNSVHLFSFSVDDTKMFPAIPKPEIGTIRTQVDLRGWSIESLSPTTVHVTLIEQSDPKGWTSKSSATPAAMTAAVAGVGDYVIRSGSPPILTRLLGAKLRQMKYEHDKATFRVEYDLDQSERGSDQSGNVECEIRCDVETWAPSIDMVIDPPPINVSCLRRHKLSPDGSGLWLTIEQPIASLEDEVSRITIRRASTKERGYVSVNGARIKVDINELSEDQVTQLRERKRTKPKRVPLDLATNGPTKPMTGSSPPATPISRTSTPAISVKSAAVAASTSSPRREAGGNDVFSDEKPRQPMTCALDVLFLLRRIHAERSPDPSGNPAGWSLVSQRNGLFIRRKLMQSISPTIAVQRGDKVVEGLTAEDILNVVSRLDCRHIWDDKLESSVLLESYGNGAHTGFLTTKASFPFRGRGFYLASLTARSGPASSQISNLLKPTVFFHASASYSERNSPFATDKVNPTSLPIGRVLIDGWILETLDPYSSTLNYQIPSTRVTHLIAVDYSGSLPVTVNAMWNTQLSRSIPAVEEYVKSNGATPAIRKPPACFEVCGDERDDDPDLIWTLLDDRSKRICTLISNTFVPNSRTSSLLLTIDPQEVTTSDEQTDVPLSVPFPRRAKAQVGNPAIQPSRAVPTASVFDGNEEPTLSTTESVPRSTSTSSIRSIGIKSRPSLNRLDSRKPKDAVLFDLEVDLRYYGHGYDVAVSSEYINMKGKDSKAPGSDVQATQKEEPEGADEAANRVQSTQTEQLEYGKTKSGVMMLPDQISLQAPKSASQALPVQVTAYDLPPPAVLAATLDPASRPKKHLVRLTLPTSKFMDAREDPLLGPDVDDAPEWYTDLRRCGASVRLTIRPRAADITDGNTASTADAQKTPTAESADLDLDWQDVPVYVQDQRISIVHVNKTSAMLQRESEQEVAHATLDRVPATTVPNPESAGKEDGIESRLPVLLRRPVAVASSLLKAVASHSSAEDAKTPSASKPQLSTVTPSTSANAIVDPNTPTPLVGNANAAHNLTTPAEKNVNASSPTTTTLPTSAASAQIMSILNSYPLSRLGASTAVSNTVASGGLFSSRSSKDDCKDTAEGKRVAESEGASKEGESKEAEPSALQAMPGQLIAQTEQIRRRLVDVRFSLSTLVFACLIAFLLGSLARSVLAPADFVLVDAVDEQAQGVQAPLAHTTSGHLPQTANAAQQVALEEIGKMLSKSSVHGDVSSPAASATTLDFLRAHKDAATASSNAQPAVTWRPLKRLVEIRSIFGTRWDLVLAAARR